MGQLESVSQFLQHLGDAVVLAQADSTILFANRAAHQLFGYPDDAMHGMALDALMARPMPDGRHARLVRSFIEKGGEAKPMMIRGDMVCRDANDRCFSARISISPVTLDGQALGVAIIQDFTPVQSRLEALQADAFQDMLTGLHNRRFFHHLCTGQDSPLQHWTCVGAIYLDLNEFKPVNDRYGHPFGDRVLAKVAQRLRERLRSEDLPVRMGGDEFLLLLNLTDQSAPLQHLERIAHELLQVIAQPMDIEGRRIEVRASAGCSLYPHQCSTLYELMQHSDRAMYAAKVSGGGVVCTSPS